MLKDAKLVRANLKQATLTGANLAGADLSGADLAGADLRDAVLVGAKTLSWNVQNANMAGVLTDEPAGKDAAQLPYRRHAARPRPLVRERRRGRASPRCSTAPTCAR